MTGPATQDHEQKEIKGNAGRGNGQENNLTRKTIGRLKYRN
jgi:hypothetical protein